MGESTFSMLIIFSKIEVRLDKVFRWFFDPEMNCLVVECEEGGIRKTAYFPREKIDTFTIRAN